MKKIILALLLTMALTACGAEERAATYTQIDAETAKTMMDETADVIVLDVREANEYNAGHIPDAVLLPVGTITEETAAQAIPATDSTVLVYCRSGNRSKTAAQALADLGYTEVYEFGGIRDWPYDIDASDQ